LKAQQLGSKALILDADVLIDFISVDRMIPSLIVKYIGPVYVVRQVLDQVKVIKSENELDDLGISIVEPLIEDFYSAANTTSQADFEDQLCFYTAKRHGFICATNDSGLQKLCMNYDVECIRGLRLILDLTKCGGISPERALVIAEQIHINNPKYITKELIERFTQELKQPFGDSA